MERFALEFTRSNDMIYRGFMPEAVRTMKQYNWPGNIRELKNFVESILVLERGERITGEMVERKLHPSIESNIHNPLLPVLVGQSTDQAEKDIILRQLFLLRQDVEIIKKIMSNQVLDHDQMQNINDPFKIHPDYFFWTHGFSVFLEYGQFHQGTLCPYP